MIDVKKLRALAGKATPGPWQTGEHVDEPRALMAAARPMVSLLGLDRDDMAIVDAENDAAYIAAANPAAVLALLDRLEAAERVCEALDDMDIDTRDKDAEGMRDRWRRIRDGQGGGDGQEG